MPPVWWACPTWRWCRAHEDAARATSLFREPCPRSTEWRGPPHSAGHGVWEPKLVLERALTEEMTGAWVMTIMTRLGGEEGRRYRLLFI